MKSALFEIKCDNLSTQIAPGEKVAVQFDRSARVLEFMNGEDVPRTVDEMRNRIATTLIVNPDADLVQTPQFTTNVRDTLDLSL